MSSANLSPVRTRSEVDAARLVCVGPLAVIAAVAANLIVYALARGVLGERLPANFSPLSPFPVVLFTTFLVGAGVVVFAVLTRFARYPVRVFLIVAALALALSFIPDLALLLTPERLPMAPGATPLAVGVLATMHVVAAVVSISILVGLTRRRA